MKPLEALSPAEARSIKFFLTDIDDTLTDEGKLLPEAFSALWRLREAGIRIIPVTGRPAGWCDCIIRQWPADAVVGENGAFVYYLDSGVRNEIINPLAGGEEGRKRLAEIKEKILQTVPGSREAKDQLFRRFDLAVDFREEEPKLPLTAAQEIKEIAESFGAEAKISSIHVNIWYGKYDKLSMAQTAVSRLWGVEPEKLKHLCAFCGDSPNDESMFAYFPCSFGVANIRNYTAYMKKMPAFVSSKEHGAGFAEIVKNLLKKTERY